MRTRRTMCTSCTRRTLALGALGGTRGAKNAAACWCHAPTVCARLKRVCRRAPFRGLGPADKMRSVARSVSEVNRMSSLGGRLTPVLAVITVLLVGWLLVMPNVGTNSAQPPAPKARDEYAAGR